MKPRFAHSTRLNAPRLVKVSRAARVSLNKKKMSIKFQTLPSGASPPEATSMPMTMRARAVSSTPGIPLSGHDARIAIDARAGARAKRIRRRVGEMEKRGGGGGGGGGGETERKHAERKKEREGGGERAAALGIGIWEKCQERCTSMRRAYQVRGIRFSLFPFLLSPFCGRCRDSAVKHSAAQLRGSRVARIFCVYKLISCSDRPAQDSFAKVQGRFRRSLSTSLSLSLSLSSAVENSAVPGRRNDPRLKSRRARN